MGARVAARCVQCFCNIMPPPTQCFCNSTHRVSLSHGVVMVVSVAFGLCVCGILFTLWFKNHHEQEERKMLREARAKGKNSGSSFGSERLGSDGAV